MLTDKHLTQAELAELSEFIRIPSISGDQARIADVRAAANWIADLVRNAGGEATIIQHSERPVGRRVDPRKPQP
jgi:acetylornithine deacetylase/succinyl-diaminopimelate desuccinylase-like protein